MPLLWQIGMCWIVHIVRQGALGDDGSADIIVSFGFCQELQTEKTVQSVTLSCPELDSARLSTYHFLILLL